MRRLIVLVLLAGCSLPAGAARAHAASGQAAGAGTAAGAGPWSWPVDGPRAVSRPFAPPASRYGSGHRGADLVSAPGAVVRAAGAGRVSYAGLLAGRGVVVVVHGALRTTYEPVAATVGVGAEVVGGQPLGLLDPGHAGCPVNACLHWGLRRGEDYLDPVRLAQVGPVRLLPLSPAAGPVARPVPRVAPGPPATPAGPGAAVPSRDAGPAGALVLASAERDRTLPLASLALLALVVGVALLARPRPRRPPPGPAAGPVGPPAPLTDVDERPVPVPVPVGADLLELDVERLRRRAS